MIHAKWLLLTFFLFPFLAQAQLQPCATPPVKSKWLTLYQRHPEHYAQPEEDTILYIPLTIHLLGNDDGTSHYPIDRLLTSLCQLNADFAQANIQFFLESPIDYIDNTAYNHHSTVVEGAQMMFENDVENTLNCYFVDDAADACGYNLPYASIALNESCTGQSHTWAHEVGHDFTLPHPFLGWEGTEYMAGDTAPVKLTYDYTYFQDTLILDTLIIDTAFTELVDGSNCEIAADGFCDTPPDYLSDRWPCTADNTNGFTEVDPTGATFQTSGELFMSYSYDDCQSKFSPQQIAAMRSYILDEKPNYLYNQTPYPQLSDQQTPLLSPAYEAITDKTHTQLVWASAGTPATYHLVVSKSFTMAYPFVDTLITDTTFLLTDLEKHNYYWQVQPFNKYSFCSPLSKRGKFTADEMVAIFEQAGERWQVGPTFVQQGTSLHLTGQHPLSSDADLSLVSVSGQVVQTQQLRAGSLDYELFLSEKCQRGLYYLVLHIKGHPVLRQKVMVY